jgi:hypothetical protein
MNDKELRKLNRAELLEILVKQSKEIDSLQKQLDEANAKLNDKNLKIEKCGTLAEAALELTNIFEKADEAAKLYLESVKQAAGSHRGDT